MERKIKKLGNINPNGKSQSGNVYDPMGLCPTLCCTDYKAPIKVVVTGGGGIWIMS